MPLRPLLVAFFVAAAAPALAEPTLTEVQNLVRQAQYPAALEKVEQILAARPKDPQARFTRGVILTELNRTADAIAVYQKLVEDFPELPEPYNNLAVIYAQQKQYDKARAALEMAIRTHPTYATAHENLGDVYAKLASQAYDKALQLDSSNVQAQGKLAQIRDLASAGTQGRTRPVATAQRPVVAAAQPSPAPAPKPALPQPAPQAAASKPVAPAPSVAAAKPAPTPSVAAAKPAPVAAEPAVAATKPTEPPAKSGEAAAQAAVTKAVNNWAAAWSRKDVKAYLAFYARDFKTPGGVPRKSWEEERQARLTKPGPISVTLSAVRVEVQDDSATVRFRQAYESASLKTGTNKTLVLVKRDGRWLIRQERVGG